MAKAFSLLVFALVLACAAPPEPATAPLSTDLANSLDELSIAFYDPESFQQFSAEGPFRLIRSDGNGVEFEGYDPNHDRAARVTVFAAKGRLWARLRVEDREFLTRLR